MSPAAVWPVQADFLHLNPHECRGLPPGTALKATTDTQELSKQADKKVILENLLAFVCKESPEGTAKKLWQ